MANLQVIIPPTNEDFQLAIPLVSTLIELGKSEPSFIGLKLEKYFPKSHASHFDIYFTSESDWVDLENFLSK